MHARFLWFRARYAWGWNAYGQLGLGHKTSLAFPSPLPAAAFLLHDPLALTTPTGGAPTDPGGGVAVAVVSVACG